MSSESKLYVERDCAVCLQSCNYPTQLPCGHIFCFLCVKGVAIQNKKCAMCRAIIPPDYLDHPVVLGNPSSKQGTLVKNEEFQWYYEGRNGWWKYDERSNSELETAFNAGETICKLLLAGSLYYVNFQNMMQVQSKDPTRRRHIKRDTPTLPAIGVAGIKIATDLHGELSKPENELRNITQCNVEEIEHLDNDGHNIHDNDENITSDQANGLIEMINGISSMNLQENLPAQDPTEQST